MIQYKIEHIWGKTKSRHKWAGFGALASSSLWHHKVTEVPMAHCLYNVRPLILTCFGLKVVACPQIFQRTCYYFLISTETRLKVGWCLTYIWTPGYNSSIVHQWRTNGGHFRASDHSHRPTLMAKKLLMRRPATHDWSHSSSLMHGDAGPQRQGEDLIDIRMTQTYAGQLWVTHTHTHLCVTRSLHDKNS